MLPQVSPEFVALGELSMSVLRRAYTEAIRRGAGSVGTLDVLTQIAVYEKRMPSWLLSGSRHSLMRMAAQPSRIPAARTVGELASRPLTEFDPEVQASLREIEWDVRRTAGYWFHIKRSDADRWETRPPWTAGVHAMLAGALRAARDIAMPFAGLTHLVLGMLWLPDCDGSRFVFPYEYARVTAVERLRSEPDLRRPDRAYPDLETARLAMWRNSGSLFDRLSGRFFARMSRLARVGPLFDAVIWEARRQAVRLGHNVVGPAHILLAMLTLDTALNAARIPVPPHHSSRNRAAIVLRTLGVDAIQLRELAVHRGGPAEPPSDALAEQLRHLRPGDPFDGADVVTAAARAQEISLAYRHPDTGTSHLLLALVEDDAGDGCRILRDLGVDPEAVRQRAERDLQAERAAWRSPTVE